MCDANGHAIVMAHKFGCHLFCFQNVDWIICAELNQTQPPRNRHDVATLGKRCVARLLKKKGGSGGEEFSWP